MIAIVQPACLPDDLPHIRRLFGEYIDSLGLDLSFQGVEAELADLPGKYAPPDGAVLLAWQAGAPVGCVALRPLATAGECEMKRLYLRPEARGQALGLRLSEAIIEVARGAGYRRMRLDTLQRLATALALYRGLGFRETESYYHNPIDGVVYMALDL